MEKRSGKKKEYTARFRARAGLAALFLALAVLLSACGQKTAEEPETKETPVPYTAAQMTVVVSAERQRTEAVYGERIWKVPAGSAGENYEQAFYGQMREFFIELAAMNGMAKERGLKLGTDERRRLAEAAERFYGEISAAEGGAEVPGREETEELFFQYALAQRLKESMLSDRRAEVSENEAKVIRVRQIVNGDRVMAETALDRALNGADFYALAQSYSDSRTIEFRAARGELPAACEEAAFALEEGEISPLTEADGKFYIFQCVDSYDEAETAIRKQAMQAVRLRRIVNEAYGKYLSEHIITVDEAAWESVVANAAQSFRGTDFFAAVREGMEDEGV